MKIILLPYKTEISKTHIFNRIRKSIIKTIYFLDNNYLITKTIHLIWIDYKKDNKIADYYGLTEQIKLNTIIINIIKIYPIYRIIHLV